MDRANLLKNISIMLSHEEYAGVNTKCKLHGLDDRYLMVSVEMSTTNG